MFLRIFFVKKRRSLKEPFGPTSRNPFLYVGRRRNGGGHNMGKGADVSLPENLILEMQYVDHLRSKMLSVPC